MRQFEQFLQEWHQHHQPHPAVNNGGNADEYFHGGTNQFFTQSRGNLGHEYGGGKAEGNGNDQSQEAGKDGTPDKDGCPYLSAACIGIRWLPGGGEEELPYAVVKIGECKHAFGEQKAANGNGENNEEETAYSGYALSQNFSPEHMLLAHITVHEWFSF